LSAKYRQIPAACNFRCAFEAMTMETRKRAPDLHSP
jgi:hypothetical protein